MTAYVIRRVVWLVPVLFVVSLITFLLMHLAPGTPFQQNPDRPLPQAVVERLNALFGLDRPLYARQHARGDSTRLRPHSSQQGAA